MEYLYILKNLIILYIKKIISKGLWKLISWQNIHHSVKLLVKKEGKIFFGRHNIIERYGNIYVGENAVLTLGNKNYFNQGLIISCQDSISIGNGCMFGPNVMIFDNNHRYYKNTGVSFDLSKKEVQIGNNCWIASNVVILKGTTIGDNCIIGASSVISGNIPENSIVISNRDLEIKTIGEHR